MLLPIAALLAIIAFIILTRLLWLNYRPGRAVTIITLATAVLIGSLALLAATGRLPWVAAVGAALLPFLRRGLSMLRYLPWLRQLFGAYQSTRSQHKTRRPGPGSMTRSEALEILGLTGNPSREQIIDAHRRLIQKVHPDRGGSNYLAQQLNEAKQILLRST